MRFLFEYPVMTGLFVAVLLVSNTVAIKPVQLGALVFDAGTLMFPFAYIFGDLFSEVYGYRRTRQTIAVGFSALSFMAAMYALTAALPALEGWLGDSAYREFFAQSPRIVAASLIAYYAGSHANAWVMHIMKTTQLQTLGLPSRTIGSTLVGQAVDSSLFVFIAFAGVFETEVIATMILSNYVFKVGVEVVFTPVTYWIVRSARKVQVATNCGD